MPDTSSFFSDSTDNVLHLPENVQNEIVRLRQHGKDDEAILQIWLGSNSNPKIAQFGAAGPHDDLTERFRQEFRDFICDGPKYTDLRREIDQKWATNKTLALSSIAAAIGAAVGVAPTVAVVIIALLLNVVFRVGRNAWCLSTKGE